MRVSLFFVLQMLFTEDQDMIQALATGVKRTLFLLQTGNTIVTAASAGDSNASDTSMTDTSTIAAADQHRPIPAATGRHRRGDGLASAAHHVCVVPWRLHPHSPCTGLGLASHRHILGNGTGRPTTLHETSVIETVAASHVICVLSRPRGHLSQG
jgi:hypothetical protein